MKRAMWTAILLAMGAVTASAQQSGKTVVSPPGPAPSANYVWVVCNQGNTVAIRDGGGNPVTTLQGVTFGFNTPYDIVGSPAHRRVFISNNGAPTVTVLDSDTLQVLRIVPVPGASNLRGICLSEDESTVFVAGQDPTAVTGGPAVFQIDAVSLADGVKTASIPEPGFGAEDCEVIRRSSTGGTGNAPGKVYFSVQSTGVFPLGFIGVIDLLPTVTVAQIPTGVAGNLFTVGTPDRMERTPDNRFVCVGCTRIAGREGAGPFTVRTIMIDVANDNATSPAFLNSTDVAHQVIDVTWRTDPGGLNRGFILALVAGVRSIYEIFDTGAFKAGPVSTAGVTQAITLRFSPLLEQVFLGDISGTGQGYQAYSAKGALVVANTPTGVGVRCQAFVAMATPACVISDICPRGALANAASNIVTVHGTGFSTLSSYGGAAAIPVGFIDANTVTVNLGGALAASVGLTINNPNLQNGTIDLFFRRYTPEQLGSFPITFPPAGGGYAMYSIPQYCSLTAFKAALTAQFGPYNPVLYRVFFYRSGRYVELNTMTDDGCDLAGEAFWMITRSGGTVTFAEPDVRANSGGSNRVIPINPGFNMISVPMTGGTPPSGQITWANVLVTDNPADFTTAQGTGTIFGLGILAPAALEFAGGSYVTADPLITGRGYWVENITPRPAYLVFAFGAVNKPGFAAGTAGGPPPPGMKPPPPPSGISEGGSSGVCGFTGVEILLALLAVRGFHRSRRLRKLVA